MPISERQAGSVAIVDVSGRLTTTEDAGRLKDKVASLVFQGRKQILLNLSDLTYTDSGGLGEMVACHTTVTRAGGSIKIAGIGKRIHDLLVMTRLITVFDTYDTEEQALASFEPTTAS